MRADVWSMWVGCHRLGHFLLAGAVLLPVAGCSSSASDKPVHKPRQVSVVERDFKISAPKEVSAGNVRFSIHNKGPDDHEFIVVRARGPRLPLRKDGLTVDEDGVEKETVGSLEPAPPGVEQLQAHLDPGRYELICNMSGHYMGGMHARLDVTS